MIKSDLERFEQSLLEQNIEYLPPICAGMHARPWLPGTTDKAVTAFAEDQLNRGVFGDVIFDAWVVFKRDECLRYQNHASNCKRDRYLKIF